MSVGERERRELQEALMEAIGPEQTDTLLGYLPPVGWADVATTRDLQTLDASLRGELHGELGKLHGELGKLREEIGGLHGEIGGLHGEIGGLHGEIGGLHGEIGRLSGRVDHQLRVQLYWFVGLVLVLVGLQVSFGIAILTR